MSSKHAEHSRWSLTTLTALYFALVTTVFLGLYALWSIYMSFSTAREDLQVFLAHEVEELVMVVEPVRGSHEAVAAAVHALARAAEEPPTAFRVRDRSGRIVVEAGDESLLARVADPILPETSWRRDLAALAVGVRAAAVPATDLVAEVIVDARAGMQRVMDYVRSALAVLLVAVILSGLSGWVAVDRGMRKLRDVATQARSLDPLAGGARVCLERAPREVRDVASALNALIDRIDGGLRDMRTFTASLAHELRSPLQNLIGETEVALRALAPAEPCAAVLRSSLEDMQELSDAVDNLVTFCRTADPAQARGPVETFDLAEEARLRLIRERRTAERRGLRLQIETSGDTTLQADREAVLRVLRNLVSNGIEVTPEGGSVRVEIVGNEVELRVTVDDDGPGVPASLGNRIFEPFVTSRAKGGARGGYGLGLAICRGTIERYGGSLSFEALPDGGTRFVGTFPREGSHAREGQGAGSAVHAGVTCPVPG